MSRRMHPGPRPRPGNREAERRTKGTVRAGFLAEGDIEFHWDGGRWSLGEKESFNWHKGGIRTCVLDQIEPKWDELG